jgi:filamentous hemagglutinin family protein
MKTDTDTRGQNRPQYLTSIFLFIIGALLFSAPAHALPTGGEVIGGDASIHQAGPGQLDIYQTTDRASIEWNQFNIDPNELVRFVQPGSESVALNRIAGADPSAILGALSANGRVFLINPNGILFGANATVDVSGLLATTMDINNADFMAGNDLFTGGGGTIINRGQIKVADNGFVFLVAPGVKNEGLIVAHLGRVVLGSGERMTIDFMGDGLLRYAIDGEVLNQVTGPDGTPLAAVDNQGTIIADGGEVVLTARASSDILGTVVNQAGVIRANSLTQRGGVIRLEASDPIKGEVEIGRQANLGRAHNAGGTVIHSGLLDVSAKEAGAAKGVVILSGERVGVSGDIHAENGSVLVTSTNKTVVTGSSAINTSGVESGNAGNTVIWSDDTTLFNGAIVARGGDVGGNAGAVEVSGYQNLGFDGTVDLAAPQGVEGTLLLDPMNLSIKAVTLGDHDAGLPNILAGAATIGADTVSEAAIEKITKGTITLEATDSIKVGSLSNGLTLSPDTSIKLRTQTGSITAKSAIVASGTGSITIEQGSSPGDGLGMVSTAKLQVDKGEIRITADGDIKVKEIAAPAATVNITSRFGSLINGGSSPFFTANVANLTAAKDIGSTGDDYDVKVTHLTLTVGGSFYVDSFADLQTLNIVSKQAGNVTPNTYLLKGPKPVKGQLPAFEFNVKDAGTNYMITRVSDVTGLNFSFQGDETILVGDINVGANAVSLTSTLGQITDDANDTVVDITAAGATLTAREGVGADLNGDLDLTVGVLAAIATNAHININNIGDLAIDTIDAGAGNVAIKTTGRILDNANDSGVDITATKATLTAPGGVGSVELDVDQNVLVSSLDLSVAILDVSSNNANIIVSDTDNIAIGTINAGTGNVEITTTGQIDDDVNDDVVDITAKKVTLTASGGIGSERVDAEDNIIVNSLDLNVETLKATSVDTDIRVTEEDDVALDVVNAGKGKVFISAAGQINDDINDDIADVIAGVQPRLTAPGGVGVGTNGTIDIRLTVQPPPPPTPTATTTPTIFPPAPNRSVVVPPELLGFLDNDLPLIETKVTQKENWNFELSKQVAQVELRNEIKGVERVEMKEVKPVEVASAEVQDKPVVEAPAAALIVAPVALLKPVAEPQMARQALSSHLENIVFNSNQFLLPSEAVAAIEKQVRWLQKNPNTTVSIEMKAHANRMKTNIEDLALGYRRLESIKEYLVRRGIDPTRITDTLLHARKTPSCAKGDKACLNKGSADVVMNVLER